jgi:hypothetical protein
MNAKMKVLALALLGLAGYAGSAVAGCPPSPVPPWTAANQFQGTVAIAAGGLDGSACRMDSSLATGASGFANAQVEDDTPTAEGRYRAAFMINLNNLASPTLTTVANVFSATSAGTGNGINLSIFGDGAGAWRLSYIIATSDPGNPSGFFSGSVPLAAGSQHVEFDLDVTNGTFALWNNNNVEASPDITQGGLQMTTVIGGIDTAFLGLAAPSDSFATTYAGMTAQFDTFDSRRQTFIGF